jgi:hypothetical protein
MWGKFFLTQTDWASEARVKFLKEKIEERDMGAADVLPLCKKRERVQPSIEKIQNALNDLQKGLQNEACQSFFSPQKLL